MFQFLRWLPTFMPTLARWLQPYFLRSQKNIITKIEAIINGRNYHSKLKKIMCDIKVTFTAECVRSTKHTDPKNFHFDFFHGFFPPLDCETRKILLSFVWAMIEHFLWHQAKMFSIFALELKWKDISGVWIDIWSTELDPKLSLFSLELSVGRSSFEKGEVCWLSEVGIVGNFVWFN
jgi:hypothetical protein